MNIWVLLWRGVSKIGAGKATNKLPVYPPNAQVSNLKILLQVSLVKYQVTSDKPSFKTNDSTGILRIPDSNTAFHNRCTYKDLQLRVMSFVVKNM